MVLTGAQPGNRLAWKHGRRSMAARLRLRETTAAMKLARALLVAADAMPSRCRPRPLRPDQMALLTEVAPAGLTAAAALGVVLRVCDRT